MNELLDIKYENGAIIEYDNGIIRGKGIIQGIASNYVPVIGTGYIVKDLSGNIPNTVYTYDTFVVHQVHIRILPQ